ncbi:hypothetical protein Q73_02905 [Bacillus coahuilensis m2-6]|uniref:RluA family pseudouridine synthase n=1 Tax=Bacillus coahuilensis TaxID=408580 RepID=UPI0007500616|nr:RluA family pseudouridine synthase [Bacillus coahuilensis]KUP09577.1 hypothetical protein Q73_02905 [Bacillus coahuilensis m2-6]
MLIQKIGNYCKIDAPSNWEGLTIEEILKDKWMAPKKLVHTWRMENSILLNNEKANWKVPLQIGDSIFFPFFIEEDYGFIPTVGRLQILFEDDHLLVVNKPTGVDTHPSHENQHDTLSNFVASYFESQGVKCRAHPIHRLDRDTSGAVIFAKHHLSQAILDRMLQHKHIKRTYLAIVNGQLQKNHDTISKPIGKDRHHPTRRRVSPNGQTAVTHYTVVKNINNLSLLELSLETGRTHQIRVHLSHLGYPILGDTLYGGTKDPNGQALHAKSVQFVHPISEEPFTILAPLPKEKRWMLFA